MSWIEYRIQPLSTESENYLNDYNQEVLEASQKITDYRLHKYSKQESIFEIDLDFMGTERSDLFIPDLPYTHIRQLTDINADLWKQEIYRCIDENNIEIDNSNVSGELTKDLLPYGLLYWSDYSISEGIISIKTNSGDIYRYTIDTDNSIVGSVPKHSVVKLYPDNNKIAIRTSKDHPEPRAIETGGGIRNETFVDSECLVKMISVYNTDQPAVQIDPPTNTEIDYIGLFNILGLHWKEPEENTYIITNSIDYLGRIEDFISKKRGDRKLETYYELFGYPRECGERLDSIRGCFDAVSGEEFVLYGMQDGVISEKLASYIRYVPYQPKPTLSSVHTALASTRDRLNVITHSSSALENIKGYTTEELLQSYKDSRRDYRWKTLDVSNYLVETN